MNTLKPRLGTICGVALILVFSLAATMLAKMPWSQSISFSPMIIGILLGMIYANTLRRRMPETWVPGIKFCSKRILRTGIILYGFRLTLGNIAEVGVPAIIIDAIIVSGTIAIGLMIGKVMKIDRDLTLLTSCGSAICGAAAVLGAEGALKTQPYKTAVAVSTVVIFGTIAMFLYPILYRAGVLGLDDNLMGIYTGSTVHEVAHVVGAGGAMNNPAVADVATIVKMMRVMMLVPVLLLLAWYASRAQAKTYGGASSGAKIVIPWFAILFLLVIVLNSAVTLPTDATSLLNDTSTFFLTMAMTALGVDTSFDKFRQAGARPFILAFVLFIWLLVGGWLLVRYLVPLLSTL